MLVPFPVHMFYKTINVVLVVYGLHYIQNKMAAIIRIKRRLDEDPAENLIVQCKKIKTGDTETDEPAELCLSLITTVKSKDAALSSSMQKSLRKQQLQMTYKSHDPNCLSQIRQEKRAQSKANRYKIVNSKRAVSVNGTELSEAGAESPAKTGAEGKENASHAASGLERVSACESGAETSNDTTPLTGPESAGACGNAEGPVIHDVEVDNDADSPAGGGPETCGSGITLNGQALVSQTVHPVPESSYVYDLYYLNNSHHRYNFGEIDSIVSIEAFHDMLIREADGVEECDDVYEDEDDSNDESNWRNDYPNQDPELDDTRRNDSDEEVYGIEDEFGESRSYRHQLNDDFLSEAMGTRLHIFGDSYIDDEDDHDRQDTDDDDDFGMKMYYSHHMRQNLDRGSDYSD